MTKIFCILILCCLHAEVHSQWVMQPSGVTDNLRGIYMHNENTGWVCGDGGKIIKTTNGGQNWFNQSSGITQTLSDIQFVNLNTGWVSARTGGKILKTTNGGQNWFIQFQTFQTIDALSFTDTLYGWAAEFAGDVFRTTNGGTTWDSVNVSPGLGDIQFINRTTGWACGIGIHFTSDGGNSWTKQLIGVSQTASISMYNHNTGWAVDQTGYRIYKTTNSGTNWLLLDSLPDCFNAHHITFTGANTGWVSGDCGNVFKTTNGGFNWYQQITGTSTFRRSAYFLNDTLGWSVGGGGIIIKTTNGGAIVPVHPISENIPLDFQLFQNYPNPFNPETNIKYSISKNNVFVKLTVFDITGREVETLVNSKHNIGVFEYRWNAVNLPSGIYFITINTNTGFIDTKKVIFIK